MDVLSYNTERGHLHIPEYGRNVQNMIEFAKKIESREERNSAAKAIIDVMGQLNPELRDVDDYTHKLWTHLFIMSNFEIDVDSPYEIPKLEKLQEKPALLEYPKNKIKYGHFGHYAEKMIQEAAKVEDKEEKEYLLYTLGNLLKKNYLTFHTHNVENSAILAHLEELSNGKLHPVEDLQLKSTNEILKQSGISVKKVVRRRSKSKKRKNN